MGWYAEKVSSVMGQGTHVDILHLKATLQVMVMMVSTNSMKPEEPFQTSYITGKIIDSKKFLYIIKN